MKDNDVESVVNEDTVPILNLNISTSFFLKIMVANFDHMLMLWLCYSSTCAYHDYSMITNSKLVIIQQSFAI